MANFKTLTLLAAVALVGMAGPVQAVDLLANGDFEITTGWGAVGSTNFPLDWDNGWLARCNAAAQQAGANAIGGSGVSAFMPVYAVATPPYSTVGQRVVPQSPSSWQFDMDFASEDPGSGNARSLNLYLSHSGDSPGILLRVADVNGDGKGDLTARSGSSTHNTVLSDAVIFDSNVELNPLVHHLQVTGHYNLDTPTYDVKLTDSNSTVHTATDLTHYFLSAPSKWDGIKMVAFYTYGGSGDYLIDNVSLIPEPSTLVLLGSGMLGLLLLLRLRRRGK